jgi:hypothetical protein
VTALSLSEAVIICSMALQSRAVGREIPMKSARLWRAMLREAAHLASSLPSPTANKWAKRREGRGLARYGVRPPAVRSLTDDCLEHATSLLEILQIARFGTSSYFLQRLRVSRRSCIRTGLRVRPNGFCRTACPLADARRGLGRTQSDRRSPVRVALLACSVNCRKTPP